MSILSHTIICAAAGGRVESIKDCKDFIKQYGLTKDDVSLRVKEDSAYVITKREINLKKVNNNG